MYNIKDTQLKIQFTPIPIEWIIDDGKAYTHIFQDTHTCINNINTHSVFTPNNKQTRLCGYFLDFQARTKTFFVTCMLYYLLPLILHCN